MVFHLRSKSSSLNNKSFIFALPSPGSLNSKDSFCRRWVQVDFSSSLCFLYHNQRGKPRYFIGLA